jgi:hypothetical protein
VSVRGTQYAPHIVPLRTKSAAIIAEQNKRKVDEEGTEDERRRVELKAGYVFALSRSDNGQLVGLVMGKRQKQYPKSGLVRMTKEEHSCLTEMARKGGSSFSRFVVESALSGQTPTNEDRMRRERAILHLARVGNNLNQVARQLNAQRGAIGSAEIDETLTEVRAACKGIAKLWQSGARCSSCGAELGE